MPAIFRRIIIIFAVIIFVLFLAIIIGAWSLGAFDSVQITEKTYRTILFNIVRLPGPDTATFR